MGEMSLNGNKWNWNDLKVPYFVTEVISGQKCINLLQQNAYEFMSFLVLRLNKIRWELQFL